MPRRSYKTQTEELLEMIEEYKAEHGGRVVDPRAVMRWAIAKGKYRKPPPSMEQRGTTELRRAMRSARHEDPQGRTVRTNHPAVYEVEGEQLTLWADIREAEPDHMRISLQQRRQGMLADVKRHKVDVESYNDNNPYGAQIPLFNYNYELDLEEAEMPTNYDEDSVDVDLGDLDDLEE